MKWNELKKFDIKKIGKDKILLLGVAGILLIASTYLGNINSNESTGYIDVEEMDYNEKMEYKLKKIIETINGVENVSVFITSKEEEGYLSTDQEGIEGVALTAEGIGNNKEVIINMISNLFNVPIHKISVVEIN